MKRITYQILTMIMFMVFFVSCGQSSRQEAKMDRSVSLELVIENHSQLTLEQMYVHQTADFLSDKANHFIIWGSENALAVGDSIKIEISQYEMVYLTAFQKKNRMAGASTLAFTTAFPLQLKPSINRLLVFDYDNPFPFRFFEAKENYEKYDNDGGDSNADDNDYFIIPPVDTSSAAD